MSPLINYDLIVEYLFESIGQNAAEYKAFKESVAIKLPKEQESHRDFHRLLSDHSEALQEYRKLSTFHKKGSELSGRIDECKKCSREYVLEYIDLIKLTNELSELYSRKQEQIRDCLQLVAQENSEIKILESNISQNKFHLISKMGILSIKLGILVPKIQQRVLNVKSYLKSQFSQPPSSKVSFQIQCLNPQVPWEDVYKIMNRLSHDSNYFLPFEFDNVMNVLKLFKDNDIVIIRYDMIYGMIFGNDFERVHPKTIKSDRATFKNILLNYMPLMFFTYGSREFILDMTKFETYPDEILHSFAFLMNEKSEKQLETLLLDDLPNSKSTEIENQAPTSSSNEISYDKTNLGTNFL